MEILGTRMVMTHNVVVVPIGCFSGHDSPRREAFGRRSVRLPRRVNTTPLRYSGDACGGVEVPRKTWVEMDDKSTTRTVVLFSFYITVDNFNLYDNRSILDMSSIGAFLPFFVVFSVIAVAARVSRSQPFK